MQRRTALKIFSLSAASAAVFGRNPFAGPDAFAGTGAAPSAVLNQVGYLTAGRKIATLSEASAGAPFQVQIAPTAQTVFRGKAADALTDPTSGDRIALADFSSLATPGNYRVVTAAGRSAPFSIGSDIYRDPLRLAVRAYYGQRCGCAVDLGDGYRHPVCHKHGAYHSTSGRSGKVKNHGGWHDAGDYGRYVVNGGITMGTLLWAWEMYPRALQNVSLDIPESGGKLPDYLAEMRWNLDWMLSLQDHDGGVWHKQTSEHFCAFIMPQDDHLISYVIGTGSQPYKSTCATADLAAAAAIAARCYRDADSHYAHRCLEAARRAYAWAAAHPDVTFTNPPGIGTGDYGDSHCGDELLWAAAELFRTTGQSQYEQAFLEHAKSLPPEGSITAPTWSFVAPMAYWTYAMADNPSDQDLKARILAETAKQAQSLIDRAKTSGYGHTMSDADYVWGSNSIAGNQSLLLLMANRFDPDPETFEAALANLHYLLGRNCFGVSWVTQVGSSPFQHPHHRPSFADGIAAPWPGLLSGGPNAHPGDAVARTVPKAPPMHMWIDDHGAYSMNEVAINWNAPLVFLLAAANSAA